MADYPTGITCIPKREIMAEEEGANNIKDLVDLAQKFLIGGKKDLGAALPSLASEYNIGGIAGWIPSGITMIDSLIGGGLPLGRITELYSVETSEGKTTLAIHFAVNTQKAGGTVIWLESEAAMDWPRAARLGLDLDNVLLWGPPHLEGGFEFILTMLEKIKNGTEDLKSRPVLIVWDTISFCPDEPATTADMYSEGMMSKPRTLKRLLTKVLNTLFACKAHLLLISQSYTVPSRFGARTETSGGKAPKQVSTIRLQLHRLEKSATDEDDTFIKSHVTTVKNKIAVPFRECVVRIDAHRGYNDIMSLATHFLDKEMTDYLKQGGGWYCIMAGSKLEQKCRWDKIEKIVTDNPEILKAWQEKARSIWPLPPDRVINPKNGWVESAPPAAK